MTGWTCKYENLNRKCPKSSPITGAHAADLNEFDRGACWSGYNIEGGGSPVGRDNLSLCSDCVDG